MNYENLGVRMLEMFKMIDCWHNFDAPLDFEDTTQSFIYLAVFAPCYVLHNGYSSRNQQQIINIISNHSPSSMSNTYDTITQITLLQSNFHTSILSSMPVTIYTFATINHSTFITLTPFILQHIPQCYTAMHYITNTSHHITTIINHSPSVHMLHHVPHRNYIKPHPTTPPITTISSQQQG